MLLRILWLKYIMNIAVHFVDYLCIIRLECCIVAEDCIVVW